MMLPAARAFAQATIKIANVVELSGAGASVGDNCRNGVELAIKEINASGGVLGQITPDPRQIELNGQDVTRLGPLELNRRGVGRTFQTLQVFGKMSVRDNLIAAAQEHQGTMLSRIFMVEQNVKSALKISDEAIALESGRLVLQKPAAELLADPNIERLFLGGAHATASEPALN